MRKYHIQLIVKPMNIVPIHRILFLVENEKNKKNSTLPHLLVIRIRYEIYLSMTNKYKGHF